MSTLYKGGNFEQQSSCSSGNLCECGSEKVLRTATTPKNKGRRFYGCSNWKQQQQRQAQRASLPLPTPLIPPPPRGAPPPRAASENQNNFRRYVAQARDNKPGDMDQQDPISALKAPLITNVENGGADQIRRSYGKDEVAAELKKQLRLAGPLIVVSFLQNSLLIISVMFIGHLGELALSSSSMASSFSGVTGFSLMLGMGSALETFCGQAYGAKQYHMLGVHMQRAILVLTLMCIPIAVLWSCTEQIFRSLKQDPEIAAQAGLYSRWLIPSIFPYGILQCQLRFLQSQNNTWPLMTSTAITSLFHVSVCWIFVHRLDFGSKGAALSSAISYSVNVLILALYIKFSPSCRKTWTGFSKQGLENLVGFLKLAVPSALMVCLEYWAYEFLVLMSGLLPNPKLETSMMSISLNTSGMVYRIPFGFSSAVSTRVSNELGAGNLRAARLAAQIVIFLAVIQGLVLSTIAVLVRDIWGYLFTNEEEVIRYLALVMPVLALSNFMDGIQGVLSGIARGCGWQNIGAYVNLGAYYLVGLPCAIILTFVFHFGGKGLWMGIISGSSLQAFLLLVIALRINWDEQARKAMDRVCSSSGQPVS